MAARYKTKVSPELIKAWDTELLPDGLSIVEIGPQDGPWHIVTFDDENAPAELEGKMVTPTISRDADGTVRVIGRDIDPA